MTEQVVAVLFDRHSHRVIRLLAAAHFFDDLHLTRLEGDVSLTVEDEHRHYPHDEEDRGDEEIASHSDVEVHPADRMEDRVPPASEGDDHREKDHGHDDEDREPAAQRYVGN